jgi:hypothetical protein
MQLDGKVANVGTGTSGTPVAEIDDCALCLIRYSAPSCFARAITLSATPIATCRPASISLR